MPQVKRYKVTANVEFTVDGPFSYAEAVALAEERLGRMVTGEKTPNGIHQVKVATVSAEEK
jgi:hypothetical protein